jgi:hypothetical protein
VEQTPAGTAAGKVPWDVCLVVVGAHSSPHMSLTP